MENVKANTLGKAKITSFTNKGEEGKEFKTYKVVNKYYNKKTDEWKESDNFSLDDLLKLRTLIDEIARKEIKQF